MAIKISGTTVIDDSRQVIIPDKIIHSGDTNTAIRFPAADTFTVETAGGERMRIDDSGNVGIGTTSPAAPLHINSGGNTTARLSSTFTDSFCALAFYQTGDDATGRILYYKDDVSQGSITFNHASSATSRSYSFTAAGSTLLSLGYNETILKTGNQERLRVTSAGNVGIGTTSPNYALDIVGDLVADRLRIRRNSDGVETVHFIDGEGTSAGDIRYNNSSGNRGHDFWTNDGSTVASRVRISGTGDVGIGTTSPSAELDVVGTTETSRIRITDTNDVTLASTDHPFQIGPSSGLNLVIDANEILARDNGAASPLYLNAEGGTVYVGFSSSTNLSVSGNVTITGSISKGSGSFKIDHPVKPDTHHLVHSFIEGPQADNIYRGKATLANGITTVNLDIAARMTEGTFAALNGNIQCFTTNEDGWTPVRGKVEGNILTIEAQDKTCTDTISWLVIGERHDQHMIDTDWTDENGRVITEPEKTELIEQ